MRNRYQFSVDADRPPPRRPFNLMAKPSGSKCNLDCTYCYYLEKENLYPSADSWVMPDDVLERYIRETIAENDIPEVPFLWQGGEPTLLGVGFFEKVLRLQRKHAQGKRISNAIQTNGTLIDDEWAAFFAKNRFLVGLSMDGPADVHDAFRVDKRGRETFDYVLRGFETLRRHQVETNVLTVVNRLNGDQPLRVYRFLKEVGAEFVQFIPVVERVSTDGLLSLAGPPKPRRIEPAGHVTDWSVLPEQYGEFLVAVYDEWIRKDVGSTFVQLFDVCLNVWAGRPPSLCWFTKSCGSALVIEHNGDVYSCDHYVYPEFKLGNILERPLGKMVRSVEQNSFGQAKAADLPAYCKKCDVRFMCNGECPKRRFLLTPDGDPGLNYLCAAYKRFFKHIDPTMKRMAQLVSSGRPAADVMNEEGA